MAEGAGAGQMWVYTLGGEPVVFQVNGTLPGTVCPFCGLELEPHDEPLVLLLAGEAQVCDDCADGELRGLGRMRESLTGLLAALVDVRLAADEGLEYETVAGLAARTVAGLAGWVGAAEKDADGVLHLNGDGAGG